MSLYDRQPPNLKLNMLSLFTKDGQFKEDLFNLISSEVTGLNLERSICIF